MLTLEAFSPPQKEWFHGPFAAGRRHLTVEAFEDYCFAFASVVALLPEGLQRFGAYSYVVGRRDNEEMFGIFPDPDPSSLGSGFIATDEGPIPVPFLNDPVTDDFLEVFGSEALTLVVLRRGELLYALVLHRGDFSLEAAENLPEACALLFEEGFRRIAEASTTEG